jgi:hypothetical protein
LSLCGAPMTQVDDLSRSLIAFEQNSTMVEVLEMSQSSWLAGGVVPGIGKGKETKLCFIGHGLMENRHGLLVDACLTLADGHAERVAALHMIEPRADRPTAITLGADKAYDAEDFVNELRSMKVTAHVAQNTSGRSSAIDGRTTRRGGYAVSQRISKRIEEAFGWIKTIAGQEKSRFRGRDRVGWAFTFAAAAYNLARLPKLTAKAC